MEALSIDDQSPTDRVSSALRTVLHQPQNVRVICRALTKLGLPDNEYQAAAYQAIGDIIACVDLNTVLRNIKSGRTGWRHPGFDEVARRIEEQDDFIRNPFEVEEGVLQCKCGSKRVFSYSKQCRGADEPMTTFAQCVSCRARWQYSG